MKFGFQLAVLGLLLYRTLWRVPTGRARASPMSGTPLARLPLVPRHDAPGLESSGCILVFRPGDDRRQVAEVKRLRIGQLQLLAVAPIVVARDV